MRLSVGIIGFGPKGQEHVARMQGLPGQELKVTAVYDPDPARLLTAREQGLRACSSLDAFLRDREMQWVILCAPVAARATLAIACIDAGKHVLCEAPGALDGPEMDRMIAMAQTYERILALCPGPEEGNGKAQEIEGLYARMAAAAAGDREAANSLYISRGSAYNDTVR